MQHFKDFEIAKVRMEEKESFHKEFEKLRKELERNYEMKAKALTDREKNAIDRLQKQQEVGYYYYDVANHDFVSEIMMVFTGYFSLCID